MSGQPPTPTQSRVEKRGSDNVPDPRAAKVRNTGKNNKMRQLPQTNTSIDTEGGTADQFVVVHLPQINLGNDISTPTLRRWQSATRDPASVKATRIPFNTSAIAQAESEQLKHEAEQSRRRSLAGSTMPVMSMHEASVYDDRKLTNALLLEVVANSF